MRPKLIAASTLATLACVAAGGSTAQARPHAPGAFFGMLTSTVKPYEPPSAARLAELKRLHRAGVGTIRATFGLPYPVTALDDFVLQAAQAHIRVLPLVTDYTHVDTSSGPTRGVTPPHPLKPFAAFVGGLAERFGPHGTLWAQHRRLRRYAITTWQVWNEPNLPIYWQPRPNPRAYLKMLRATSKAIHRQEPHASVITAGIPDSKQSKPLNYIRYLRKLLHLGARRYVKGIAVHAYSKSLPVLVRYLKSVRRLLDRTHNKRLKIYVTEVGWADHGHRNPMVVGAKRQAALIKKSYRYVVRERRRLRIGAMFYFQWRDPSLLGPGAHPTSWGYHTGLLRQNGKPKPAYRAYRRVVRQLRR